MIYVLLRPETLWQKLNFYLRGIAPSKTCEKVRYGGGTVECVHPEEDSCEALPMSRVLEVMWDGGYAADVAEVKAEYRTNVRQDFGAACGVVEPDEDEGQPKDLGDGPEVLGYM